jgi:hypothetical protein
MNLFSLSHHIISSSYLHIPTPTRKKTPYPAPAIPIQNAPSKQFLFIQSPSIPLFSPFFNPLSSHAQPTHRAGSTDKCSPSPLNSMLWILMICVISSNVSFSDLICNAKCKYAITLASAQSIDPSTQHSKAKATQRYHPTRKP